MNNIYLIGMPGCGKSTIGKIISKRLKLKHIDADEYLENKYSQTIPNIFSLYGEDDFRKKESIVIEELSKMNNLLVSTGGGVVVKDRNKEIMKNSGAVVFIDTTPDNILKNSSLSGRPLLKDKNRIYEIYKSRIDLYKDFADIVIDNNSSIDTAANEIIKYLSKE
jgi:shikimate kinase